MRCPRSLRLPSALCQPSLYESFSIVLMESWLQGRPVLVHADCPVTSEHVATSGGGFTFHDYASFRDMLNYLLDNPTVADEAGQRGRSYVLEHYNWHVVMERLVQGIVSCLAPREYLSTIGMGRGAACFAVYTCPVSGCVASAC